LIASSPLEFIIVIFSNTNSTIFSAFKQFFFQKFVLFYHQQDILFSCFSNLKIDILSGLYQYLMVFWNKKLKKTATGLSGTAALRA
jgi:hypothetical protein